MTIQPDGTKQRIDELDRIAQRFDDLSKQAPRIIATCSEKGPLRSMRSYDNSGNRNSSRSFERLSQEAATCLGIATHNSAEAWLGILFDAETDFSRQTETIPVSWTNEDGSEAGGVYRIREIENAAEVSAIVCRRLAAELRAVIDTRGLDAPAPTPTVSALPAGADAIDEHDVALLAFLNLSPSLRRKVTGVLPEKGPQDRKAVAKRLRKLADRTPPLVDYPEGGRSGVAILPAGVEALKRATAPMPR